MSHSVSGQKANSDTAVAKPKFDGRLYGAMKLLMKEKLAWLKDADIRHKVQSVKKKYKKIMWHLQSEVLIMFAEVMKVMNTFSVINF